MDFLAILLRTLKFSLIKDINLSYDDIYLIDELNDNAILLHNIINGFGEIYHSYLLRMNSSFSFQQYIDGMEVQFQLEQNLPYLYGN